MTRTLRALRTGLLIWLAVFLAGPAQARAQTQNQAGLVIEFGDGSLYTGCTAFDAESISGYDLLASSGMSLETAFDPSQGVAVCKIGSDGCPADDCFCQMPEYWSYWNWVDGSWSYAGSGSSANQVSDGDVDGWSWGTGSPPPAVPFSQLCAPPPPPPPSATQTSAPSPTQPPEPQPSDTLEPEPTHTFIPPTYTQVPSQTPLPVTPTSTARPTLTSTISPNKTAQATQQAAVASPNPIKQSGEAVKISVPTSTAGVVPTLIPAPETKAETKTAGRSMVGYAVFGALLVGLGLSLARIIIKGQRP